MFDLSIDKTDDLDFNGSTLSSKQIKRKIKNDKIHFIKARALNDLCPLPNKNEQYRIITEKQFNAYSLILALIEKCIIEELYLAIYRINKPTVDSIIELIENNKITKANFVISNFFNQTKRPEEWAIRLKDYCDSNDRCSHVYTHNHAKVLALKNKYGHYVFEGSGNMSDNARIEQYLYEENKEAFNFHKEWINNLSK